MTSPRVILSLAVGFLLLGIVGWLIFANVAREEEKTKSPVLESPIPIGSSRSYSSPGYDYYIKMNIRKGDWVDTGLWILPMKWVQVQTAGDYDAAISAKIEPFQVKFAGQVYDCIQDEFSPDELSVGLAVLPEGDDKPLRRVQVEQSDGSMKDVSYHRVNIKKYERLYIKLSDEVTAPSALLAVTVHSLNHPTPTPTPQ